MIILSNILLINLVVLCNGQIQSPFYPPKVSSPKEFRQASVVYPLAFVSETKGNEYIASVNKLSKYPLNIARDIEELEPFTSNFNATVSEDFVEQYVQGVHKEDVILHFEELVRKYGYPFENHEVFTEDGYMLSLFRIPGNRTTVFLMHGLLGSADDFIVAGVESGLAYLLADKGYDVWLGNARGNKHSRKHISLDPAKSVFWDFSWHEIGLRDLPAMIDYILDLTKKSSLKYIGHSQGTTSFFVLASIKPEYNTKVSLMIAMSPLALMSRTRSPLIRLLSPETLVLQEFSRNLGINEFSPNTSLLKMLKQLVCGNGTLVNIICNNPLILMTGFYFNQLNASNLPVVFGHMPAGASVKQIIHYGQALISEDFRCFDYGSMENLERYGVMTPPSYALENIVTPVSIFFSVSDWLADPQDVLSLSYRLKRVVDMYKVPDKGFSNLDFVIGKDVKTLVYARVFEVLKGFSR